MQFEYQIGGETITLRVEKSGEGYRVAVGDRALTVDAVIRRQGALTLLVNGTPYTAHVAADGPRRWVALDGRTYQLTVPQAGTKAQRGRGAGHRHDSLEAQMPGVVRKVLVSAGEAVERGQALVVLEAMKMELRVAAPHAGVVERVAVREGETVQRGQLLVEVVEG
ncbi:MAG: biotin/lipoyl-binding protein [Anaerolineales bacterium]|nr:biotin/lipoyl-binding protein [Anaerolineales bacterium]